LDQVFTTREESGLDFSPSSIRWGGGGGIVYLGEGLALHSFTNRALVIGFINLYHVCLNSLVPLYLEFVHLSVIQCQYAVCLRPVLVFLNLKGAQESISPAYVAKGLYDKPFSYSIPSPHRLLFQHWSVLLLLLASFSQVSWFKNKQNRIRLFLTLN
jgi:hypothetical protein